MGDDRESPSAGWREVYHEMAVDPGVEAPTARCPDCGRPCENVARDVYDCGEHGLFRASGTGGRGASDDGDGRAGDGVTDDDGRDSPDSDDEEEIDRWARGTAD